MAQQLRQYRQVAQSPQVQQVQAQLVRQAQDVQAQLVQQALAAGRNQQQAQQSQQAQLQQARQLARQQAEFVARQQREQREQERRRRELDRMHRLQQAAQVKRQKGEERRRRELQAAEVRRVLAESARVRTVRSVLNALISKVEKQQGVSRRPPATPESVVRAVVSVTTSRSGVPSVELRLSVARIAEATRQMAPLSLCEGMELLMAQYKCAHSCSARAETPRLVPARCQ